MILRLVEMNGLSFLKIEILDISEIMFKNINLTKKHVFIETL